MKIMPSFKLEPIPLSDDAAQLPKFRWADGHIGTRHKLGGKPDFIES